MWDGGFVFITIFMICILFYYYCQYHHHYCCFCWEAGTDREINFAWGGLALDGYVCK